MNMAADTSRSDMVSLKNTSVTEIKHDGLKREYRIALDRHEVEAEINRRLTRMQAKANLPGFRKGRVPIEVLRQREGRRLHDEVTASAVMAVAGDRLKTDGPSVRSPEIEPAEEGDSVVFTLSFEKMPEMPVLDFNTMELTLYKLDPEKNRDALIKFALRLLNRRQAKSVEAAADHEAAPGDLIQFIGIRSAGSVRERLPIEQGIIVGEDTCFPESIRTIGLKEGKTLSFVAKGLPVSGDDGSGSPIDFTYDLEVSAIMHQPGWGELTRQIDAMEDDRRQKALDGILELGLRYFEEQCASILDMEMQEIITQHCTFALPVEFREECLETMRKNRAEDLRQALDYRKEAGLETAIDDLPDSESITLTDEDAAELDSHMRYHLYVLAYQRQHNLLPTRGEVEAYEKQHGEFESREDAESAYQHLSSNNYRAHIQKRFLIREQFLTLDELHEIMGTPPPEDDLDNWLWIPDVDNGDADEHPDSDS